MGVERGSIEGMYVLEEVVLRGWVLREIVLRGVVLRW